MVKWACDRHEADIVLEDNTPTGLVVIVTFDALKGCFLSPLPESVELRYSGELF